jgi:Uncharacterised protein family UPF0047
MASQSGNIVLSSNLLSLSKLPEETSLKVTTEYLTFRTKTHRAYIDLTPQVEAIVATSGVKEGMVLVSAMHITAGVNDNESGLIEDIDQWLEHLAPFKKDYKQTPRDRRGQRRFASQGPTHPSRSDCSNHGGQA